MLRAPQTLAGFKESPEKVREDGKKEKESIREIETIWRKRNICLVSKEVSK